MCEQYSSDLIFSQRVAMSKFIWHSYYLPIYQSRFTDDTLVELELGRFDRSDIDI